MNEFLYQVFNGLASGSIYASMALALVMIYRSTGHVNFAQGEMAMFSTFIAWMLISAGLPYWAAFLAAIAISFLLSAVVEVTVIRPMHDAPLLSIVVVFIGLLVFVHSLAGLLFGHTVRQFPSPFDSNAWYASALLPAHQAGALLVTTLVLALLFAFFRYTPLGLTMRAAAVNPVSARLTGINVDRMLMLGWAIAGGIGAISGMMAAPVLFLDPTMMTGVLLYAFAAALVGGIDSPLGAVVGGFMVGVMENVLGTYLIGTELKLTVALVLIVGVLIVRPAGLFGKPVIVKV